MHVAAVSHQFYNDALALVIQRVQCTVISHSQPVISPPTPGQGLTLDFLGIFAQPIQAVNNLLCHLPVKLR